MKAKTLAIIIVTLALVVALALGVNSAIADHEEGHEASGSLTVVPNSPLIPPATVEPPIQLSGLVTLNGVVAPPGVSVTVLKTDDSVCGNTTTQQGGRYDVQLASNCRAATVLNFRLDAVPDAIGTPVTLTSEPQQDATIEFGTFDFGLLSLSDLLTLGVLTEAQAVDKAVSDAVSAAEEAAAAAETIDKAQGGDVVLGEGMILAIVIVAVVGAFLVLALLAKLKYLGLSNKIDFRLEIQALILILILAAILLLGMSGKMPPQGIIAVLSLIAGFALGQVASGAGSPSGE